MSGRRLYSWWPAMINFFFGREGPWAYHEPDNYSNKEYCGMMYHDLHMQIQIVLTHCQSFVKKCSNFSTPIDWNKFLN